MTSGMAVILGPVGKNFASGMSGGVVFFAGSAHFDAASPEPSLGPTPCAFSAARDSDPDVRRLYAFAAALRRSDRLGACRRAASDWPRSLAYFAKLSLTQEPAAKSRPSLVWWLRHRSGRRVDDGLRMLRHL